jgi:hypothetical protein
VPYKVADVSMNNDKMKSFGIYPNRFAKWLKNLSRFLNEYKRRNIYKKMFWTCSKAKEKFFPNPLVGAVIVNNSKINSEGFHKNTEKITPKQMQ